MKKIAALMMISVITGCFDGAIYEEHPDIDHCLTELAPGQPERYRLCRLGPGNEIQGGLACLATEACCSVDGVATCVPREGHREGGAPPNASVVD